MYMSIMGFWGIAKLLVLMTLVPKILFYIITEQTLIRAFFKLYVFHISGLLLGQPGQLPPAWSGGGCCHGADACIQVLPWLLYHPAVQSGMFFTFLGRHYKNLIFRPFWGGHYTKGIFLANLEQVSNNSLLGPFWGMEYE